MIIVISIQQPKWYAYGVNIENKCIYSIYVINLNTDDFIKISIKV